MSRIQPDRPGYDGYECEGITYDIIDPIDCTVNFYELLPPNITGSQTNASYEDLSALETDPTLEAIHEACDLSFNPFTGTFIDMYQRFIDNTLDHYIADDCYETTTSVYGQGFLGPKPMTGVTGDCGCGNTVAPPVAPPKPWGDSSSSSEDADYSTSSSLGFTSSSSSLGLTSSSSSSSSSLGLTSSSSSSSLGFTSSSSSLGFTSSSSSLGLTSSSSSSSSLGLTSSSSSSSSSSSLGLTSSSSSSSSLGLTSSSSSSSVLDTYGVVASTIPVVMGGNYVVHSVP